MSAIENLILPPHHIESEQSVLGALLLDSSAFERVDWLVEDDFYRHDHRTIFRHIARLLAEKKPVDVVTVAESMVDAGIPEREIGLPYLGELAANTPSAANIKRYAEIVVEKRQRRDLLVASNRIAELAVSAAPAGQCIDDAAGIVFALADQSARDDRDAQIVGSVLPGVIEEIQQRFDNGGQIVGLPTGFDDLDAMTAGFQPGDLIIVAGRPSMGKTAFALNIAENAATKYGKAALVFSMEMGKKQLVERSIASLGTIPLQAIKNGQLTDDQFDRLAYATGLLHRSKLIIDDRPALTVARMRSRCRKIARQHGLDLIVVDYLQLAVGDAISKNGNREQEVSSISRGLKALAREFEVPVIALSQLSRKVEERGDKRPMMSDLRDSGAIEQDADVILMMYRDEYYHENSPDKGVAEIIIGKQRMGETGKVTVAFQGQYSRFKSLTAEAIANIEAARRAAREAKAMDKPMRRKVFEA